MPRALEAMITAARSLWAGLAARSPLARLGQASLVAALASVAAKSIGFVKELLVASAFGVSDALDVYLLAFVLTGFPVCILLNAVQAVMISTLAAVRDLTARTVRRRGCDN